jgi:DNA-binding MarR family transcriptional regulator
VPNDRQSSARDLNDLAFRLHSAALHLMRRIRREDEVSGLSGPRMSALSTVVFGGPRTIGEMARMEQVSAPTMTRLVAGLERDGFVRRAPSPADARAVVVEATPKGRRVLEEGRSRRVEFLASRLRALPARDRAALSRAADLMHEMYEDAR